MLHEARDGALSVAFQGVKDGFKIGGERRRGRGVVAQQEGHPCVPCLGDEDMLLDVYNGVRTEARVAVRIFEEGVKKEEL